MSVSHICFTCKHQFGGGWKPTTQTNNPRFFYSLDNCFGVEVSDTATGCWFSPLAIFICTNDDGIALHFGWMGSQMLSNRCHNTYSPANEPEPPYRYARLQFSDRDRHVHPQPPAILNVRHCVIAKARNITRPEAVSIFLSLVNSL